MEAPRFLYWFETKWNSTHAHFSQTQTHAEPAFVGRRIVPISIHSTEIYSAPAIHRNIEFSHLNLAAANWRYRNQKSFFSHFLFPFHSRSNRGCQWRTLSISHHKYLCSVSWFLIYSFGVETGSTKSSSEHPSKCQWWNIGTRDLTHVQMIARKEHISIYIWVFLSSFIFLNPYSVYRSGLLACLRFATDVHGRWDCCSFGK